MPGVGNLLSERDSAHVWVTDIGWIRLDLSSMKSRAETRASHAGGGLLRYPGASQEPLIPVAVLQGQQNLSNSDSERKHKEQKSYSENVSVPSRFDVTGWIRVKSKAPVDGGPAMRSPRASSDRLAPVLSLDPSAS